MTFPFSCHIEQKSQIKYLGFFIDKHLKWDAQLQHINNKLTKNLGILFKLRHYMPINALKPLYYSLIFPYLNYGLMSWGTACQTKLSKIKVSQNNCLRCIFFANKRESPAPYFTLLRTLKLKCIFKLKIAGLVHKIQFQKKGNTSCSLPQFIIIVLDMPLARTYIGHLLDLIMAQPQPCKVQSSGITNLGGNTH